MSRAPYKARRIDAGKYRTRCIVEQPVETVADMHSIEITWTKYGNGRWLCELPTTGKEYQAAMTTIPMLSGIYRTRADSESLGITPRMRIRIGDRVLHIDSVADEGGEHREVVIRCIEEAVT